ncbi:unnamed protein product [Diatraea saccharalis]|uniref:HAT C-terminal dimerisation domain-containing protein n=1 Tax=Diatraea saccharalis TaxID=40085 RepID=A0A9N9RA15_9NEOP|nr:unnamed protein product [Diatraea saccharalis]
MIKWFCNACLSGAKEENDEISFGLAKIKSYVKTVSTGNLIKHLRDFHNLKEESSGKATRNIEQFFQIQPRRSQTTVGTPSSSLIKNKDSWLLARDMALWFCKSLMPFDSVSDEGMNDFFQKYDIISCKEDMPSRDTVSRTALDDVYESMLENVKVQIKTDAAGHAAITFDLWTDQYRHLSYITFTLHYLTADFELKSFTLCTKLIEGKKTGAKIQETLNETKECFDLQEKVLHSVTDAGSNVKRAISLAALDSHLCLGHALHNLVTVDGIGSVPELADLIKKCKKIVKTVRYRLPDLEREAEKEQIQFLQSLERVSEHLEMDENEPIIDDEVSDSHSVSGLQTNSDEFGSINHVPSIKTSSPTRWHSMLAMLESLAHFCNRNPVNNLLAQVNQHDLKIYQQEWNLLEDLIRFLRKFREVVEMLSTQKTASLNLALVFRLEIRDILNSLSDEETLIMLSLKNKMLAKLDKRFPITDKIVVSALLDPRFISLSQIDSYLEQKNTTRAAFLAEYIKIQPNISNHSTMVATSPPAVLASTSNESILSKLSKKHSSSSTSSILTSVEFNEVDQECWRYLAAANASDVVDDDVLQYWRNKSKTFPHLSQLARAILAIPATSTPSERVFSIAGLTVTAKRSRLNPPLRTPLLRRGNVASAARVAFVMRCARAATCHYSTDSSDERLLFVLQNGGRGELGVKLHKKQTLLVSNNKFFFYSITQ